LPSSEQGLLLLTWMQPVAGLQESSVQTFPSSHLNDVPGRHPKAVSQVSVPLHASPSLQIKGVPGRHPCAVSQVSVPLHTSPSSQIKGAPGRHPKAVSQVSVPLHALLSSQSTGSWTHIFPAGGDSSPGGMLIATMGNSQWSIVQRLPSLQSSSGQHSPATQAPEQHTSPVPQSVSSTHPVMGTQAPSLHSLSPGHSFRVPAQLPLASH